MRPNLRFVRCLTIVGLFSLSALTHAIASTKSKATSSAQIDPQAQTLCAQVTAAYRALTTYTDSINILSSPGMRMQGVSLQFHRPNLIIAANLWDPPHTEITSDGTNLLIITTASHKEVARRAALQGSGFIRRTLALTGVTNSGVVPDLLDGSDFLTLLKQQGLTSLKLGPTTANWGTAAIQLIATFAPKFGGATTVYYVGKSDHLLRRVLTTSRDTRHIIEERHYEAKANPPISVTAFTVPPAPVIDPRAMTILHQMNHSYQSLQSYSDTEELKAIISPNTPDAKDWSEANLEVAFQRPNLAHVIVHSKAGDTYFISDGKFLFQPLEDAKDRYIKSPVIKNQDVIIQALGTIKSDLVFLVDGQELLNPGPMLTKSLSLGAPDNLDGVPVDTVVQEDIAPRGGIAVMTFSIGHDDHLLRRLQIVMTAIGQQPIETTQTCAHVTMNSTLPSDTWIFHPPFGAKGVTPAIALYNPHLDIGVKPFAFQTTDLDGKPISLAQYKGKVTQLNFWISSEDEVQEQAQNLSLYHKYHHPGYDIIGIYLGDQLLRNGHLIMGTDNYPPLYNFLQQHPLPWRQIFDGYQWAGDLAQLYGVSATMPLNILIGRDGRIVALNPRLGDTAGTMVPTFPDEWEHIIQQALKSTNQKPH